MSPGAGVVMASAPLFLMCMQLSLFESGAVADAQEKFWVDLYRAYFLCRKSKRNAAASLAFERDFEAHLEDLGQSLLDGSWRPGRSNAFIVNRPVKREIFAAPFADRVVHHWFIGHLNPFFERLFLPVSHACRKGMGTHHAIRQVAQDVDQSSNGGSTEAWALKMDIQGFFMSIDKRLLWRRLSEFMSKSVRPSLCPFDFALLMQVGSRLVLADPASTARIRGSARDWQGLPRDKSLFHAAPGHGLPIGNLTSQVLANFFLHPFDEWMVSRFSSCGYARYVDDFVLISSCQWALRGAVSKVRVKLREEFALKLHPRKVKLQRVRHGVPFLGVVVFPGLLLPDRRPRGSFREAIHGFNRLAVREGDAVAMGQWDSSFRASLNSYLGGLSQTRSQGFRLRSWRKVKAPWQERFVLSSDARKIQPRR